MSESEDNKLIQVERITRGMITEALTNEHIPKEHYTVKMHWSDKRLIAQLQAGLKVSIVVGVPFWTKQFKQLLPELPDKVREMIHTTSIEKIAKIQERNEWIQGFVCKGHIPELFPSHHYEIISMLRVIVRHMESGIQSIQEIPETDIDRAKWEKATGSLVHRPSITFKQLVRAGKIEVTQLVNQARELRDVKQQSESVTERESSDSVEQTLSHGVR